jgi:hypothetical protein
MCCASGNADQGRSIAASTIGWLHRNATGMWLELIVSTSARIFASVA